MSSFKVFISFFLLINVVSGNYTSCYTTPIQTVNLRTPFISYNYKGLCKDYGTQPDEWNIECVNGFDNVQTHTRLYWALDNRCTTCKSPTCDIQHVCCKPDMYTNVLQII